MIPGFGLRVERGRGHVPVTRREVTVMESWTCQRCGDGLWSSTVPDDLLCLACRDELDAANSRQEVASNG